jgi:hypothetical protein
MARYNKIFLGPFTEPRPQVREAIGDVPLTPGTLVVQSSGKWVLAGASTVGKVWIVQDNYLQLKGVNDAWADEDRVVAMELLPNMLYAGRIADSVNISAVGVALTPAANGLLGIASTSDLIIGYSEEIYNNSSGTTQLIKFRPAGLSYLSASGT